MTNLVRKYLNAGEIVVTPKGNYVQPALKIPWGKKGLYNKINDKPLEGVYPEFALLMGLRGMATGGAEGIFSIADRAWKNYKQNLKFQQGQESGRINLEKPSTMSQQRPSTMARIFDMLNPFM